MFTALVYIIIVDTWVSCYCFVLTLFSGAGKTSLLNILARQNLKNLHIDGTILVNGRAVGSQVKSISAYCQQEDLFIGTLTVKEHLYFQVSFDLFVLLCVLDAWFYIFGAFKAS